MSLYNTLFGINPCAPYLLSMLEGLTSLEQIPRFRDCFLHAGHIVIYTRTGGGNRKDYVEGNNFLRTITGYVEDHDDMTDSTYAHFVYAIPDADAAVCAVLSTLGGECDPQQRWAQLLEKLRDPAHSTDPEVVEAREKLRPVMERIAAALQGEGPAVIEV